MSGGEKGRYVGRDDGQRRLDVLADGREGEPQGVGEAEQEATGDHPGEAPTPEDHGGVHDESTPRGHVLVEETHLRHRQARTAEAGHQRSEEHTSELQSLMRISYAVFCLKKKKHSDINNTNTYRNHNKSHLIY